MLGSKKKFNPRGGNNKSFDNKNLKQRSQLPNRKDILSNLDSSQKKQKEEKLDLAANLQEKPIADFKKDKLPELPKLPEFKSEKTKEKSDNYLPKLTEDIFAADRKKQASKALDPLPQNPLKMDSVNSTLDEKITKELKNDEFEIFAKNPVQDEKPELTQEKPSFLKNDFFNQKKEKSQEKNKITSKDNLELKEDKISDAILAPNILDQKKENISEVINEKLADNNDAKITNELITINKSEDHYYLIFANREIFDDFSKAANISKSIFASDINIESKNCKILEDGSINIFFRLVYDYEKLYLTVISNAVAKYNKNLPLIEESKTGTYIEEFASTNSNIASDSYN